MTGKESSSWRTKKKKQQQQQQQQSNPSQDLKVIILKVLCCHLMITKVSLTMVVRLLLDYLYALFYLVFFHHIHLTRMPPLMQRLAKQGTGGSVVEFSFTRREARVRFPPLRFSLIIWIRQNVNDRKAWTHRAGQKGVIFVILFLGRTVYFASNSIYF